MENMVKIGDHEYDLRVFKAKKPRDFKDEVDRVHRARGIKAETNTAIELWDLVTKYRKEKIKEIEANGEPTATFAGMGFYRIYDKEKLKVVEIRPDVKPGYIDKKDFIDTHHNPKLDPLDDDSISAAYYWLNLCDDSKENPVYRSIEYRPDLKPGANPAERIYNIYSDVREKAVNSGADIQPILDHFRNIWCDGDDVQYEYLLNWLAWKIQHPAEKPGTAIGLSSKQGLGKDIIVNNLLAGIYGKKQCHNTAIDDTERRFNGHLAHTQWVVFNEGGYTHQKKGIGFLKALITNAETTIEKKGIDIESTTPTYCAIMFVTNEDWIIKIEQSDRRYTVLTPTDKVPDSAYFDRLAAAIENGKWQFLYYMLQRDVTNFNPHKCIETKAKEEQRSISLSSFYQFWIQAIEGNVSDWIEIRNEEKYVDYTDSANKPLHKPEVFKPWGSRIGKTDLYKIYKEYSEFSKTYKPVSADRFYREMKKMKPITALRANDMGQRKWVYKFCTTLEFAHYLSKELAIPINVPEPKVIEDRRKNYPELLSGRKLPNMKPHMERAWEDYTAQKRLSYSKLSDHGKAILDEKVTGIFMADMIKGLPELMQQGFTYEDVLRGIDKVSENKHYKEFVTFLIHNWGMQEMSGSLPEFEKYIHEKFRKIALPIINNSFPSIPANTLAGSLLNTAVEIEKTKEKIPDDFILYLITNGRDDFLAKTTANLKNIKGWYQHLNYATPITVDENQLAQEIFNKLNEYWTKLKLSADKVF
jgi:hypothetical protein